MKFFVKILFTVLLLLQTAAALHAQPPQQLPSLIEQQQESSLPTIKGNLTPEEIIKKNIFVQATASSKDVYVGEPLLVTYKLFTALNSSRARVSKQPAFNGCSVLELNNRQDEDESLIDGKLFHVFTIRKVQVIPLQEGTLQLGQAYVDNTVQMLHSDNNSVENFSSTLTNEPLSVEVKPLPSPDQPATFGGSVGNFTINASIDSNEVPVGENATLRITIKGTGDFASLHAPQVRWPQGVEHFEISDTQHIDQYSFPVSGYKTFSIPFIGNKTGNIIFDPVSFSFFEPVSGTYKTVSSAKLAISFTKPLSRDEQMKDAVTEDVDNSKYLWIVGAIAFTVISILLLSTAIKAKRKNTAIPAKEATIIAAQETPIVKKDISAEIITALHALEAAIDAPHFFADAKHLLMLALQGNLAAQDLSEQELTGLMQQHNTDPELMTTCSNILVTCNRQLYSPVAEEGMQEKIYFELTAVIKKMYIPA